jgi:hypothetical protein
MWVRMMSGIAPRLCRQRPEEQDGGFDEDDDKI